MISRNRKDAEAFTPRNASNNTSHTTRRVISSPDEYMRTHYVSCHLDNGCKLCADIWM